MSGKAQSDMTAANIYTEAPDMDTFGGRLSRARDASGITPAQLARRLGVKTMTIQAWESDRSEPRANRLTMLAAFLGVSPTWLLSGVGQAPEEEVRLSAIRITQAQLGKLKDLHAEMAGVIDSIEDELARLSRTQ